MTGAGQTGMLLRPALTERRLSLWLLAKSLLVGDRPDEDRRQQANDGGYLSLSQPREAEAGEGLDDEEQTHDERHKGLVNTGEHMYYPSYGEHS